MRRRRGTHDRPPETEVVSRNQETLGCGPLEQLHTRADRLLAIVIVEKAPSRMRECDVNVRDGFADDEQLLTLLLRKKADVARRASNSSVPPYDSAIPEFCDVTFGSVLGGPSRGTKCLSERHWANVYRSAARGARDFLE
jgi:hypothetical protein